MSVVRAARMVGAARSRCSRKDGPLFLPSSSGSPTRDWQQRTCTWCTGRQLQRLRTHKPPRTRPSSSFGRPVRTSCSRAKAGSRRKPAATAAAGWARVVREELPAGAMVARAHERTASTAGTRRTGWATTAAGWATAVAGAARATARAAAGWARAAAARVMAARATARA
eukprot:scaffold45807_cov56-Phaeocystis_antarctica.AAC.6